MRHSILFASFLTFSALGCDEGKAPASQSDGITKVVKSSLQRQAPALGAEASAAEDLARFSWDFYVQAADGAHNFVYSPYSISIASAMLSAGAEGETLSQIQTALHFRSTGTSLHQAHNALSQALASRNHGAQSLRASNDFWMLPDLRPTSDFLDPLAQYYGAGVHLAPFDAHPEESRRAINAKVSGDTGDLIPELLPKNSIDPNVVFVLTNALYFKAAWAAPFNKSATGPAAFHSLDGTQSDVPMMHKVEEFAYVAGDGFMALALPYEGNELELVIVVPDDFSAFQATLSANSATELRASLQSTAVNLGLPQFEVASEIPLKDELQAAGMVDAFQPGRAQFPHIEDGNDIFISDAFHKARIVVDEAGTEAAAATAFVGTRHSVPTPPVTVAVDRPFIYWIRDVQTDAVLFLGHYVQAN